MSVGAPRIEGMSSNPSSARAASAVPDADRLVVGLNPQQREAVLHRGSPLLIVAGAGSGKTRVLTHRIAHLIATGEAWPSQILAITFTNKAANEMRERVGALLGGVAEGMWISTFHSACVRILRREIAELGYRSGFTIYDTHDSRTLLKRIIKEHHADADGLTPAAAQHRISQLKNELRDADDLTRAEGAHSPADAALVDVFRDYDRALQHANALDFDDILVQTVHLLEAFPEVRRRYQRRFRHVLVDEYQDTNHAQYELIRLLATPAEKDGPAPELTVVGDSDQSIYAFRGADLRNITHFDEDFPGTRMILLEQNYRSTQRILSAANAVIGHNFDRADKNLWSALGDGDRITVYAGYSAHDEAQFVADEIRRLHREGLGWSDIAVFYRTNAQTRALEEILVRAGVPYRLIGGTRFYDRAEVKDVLAYLIAVVNPADDLAVRRILNVPRRGIGPTTEQRLVTFAAREGIDLPAALVRAEEISLGPKVTGAMTALGGALADARAALADQPLDGVVADLLDRVGLVRALRESQDPQDEARAENLDELLAQLVDYTEREADATLADFLADVQLTAAADELDAGQGAVSLMTLHTAKGLEYPAVFITGLEEGLLPHRMSLDEVGGIAEERRLFYVGITRAQRHLALSMAVSRTAYGQTNDQIPSRFLDEIPEDLLDWRQRPEEVGGVRALGRGGRWRDAEDDVRHDGRGRRALAGGARPTHADHPGRRPASGHRWANEITTADIPRGQVADLAEGDRIRHGSFGEGIVLQLTGRGAKQVATVRFDSGARKKLVVAVAPIERA